MLNWRSLTSDRDSRHTFMVTGTELSVAPVPGYQSRFCLYEVRSYDAAGEADRVFRVRDAATVTLAQVREGVRPAVVGTFDSEDAALAFCASF
jgi:hypothetical protein